MMNLFLLDMFPLISLVVSAISLASGSLLAYTLVNYMLFETPADARLDKNCLSSFYIQ